VNRPDRNTLLARIGNRPVVVLAGGWSREREVSLRSGKNVHASLVRQGFHAVFLDMTRTYLQDLVALDPAVVVIMLHGRPGEDGSVQGALETLGIPYTGSGVVASALGMDKWLSSLVFQAAGLPVVPTVLIPASSPPKNHEEAIKTLPAPYIVKPRAEGSSIGMEIFPDLSSLLAALPRFQAEFGDMLVQPFLPGRTVTTGILGTGEESFALPVLELRPKDRPFYDYEAKYTHGATEFILPAELPENLTKALQEASLQAHRLLGCRGFSRVDGLVVGDRFYLLEVNTIPGMTELSDLPAQAKAAGIAFDELVLFILQSAFE